VNPLSDDDDDAIVGRWRSRGSYCNAPRPQL